APTDMAGGRIAFELAKMAGGGGFFFLGEILFLGKEGGGFVHARIRPPPLPGVGRGAGGRAGHLPDQKRVARGGRQGQSGSPPGDRFFSSYQVSDIAFRVLTINMRKKNLNSVKRLTQLSRHPRHLPGDIGLRPNSCVEAIMLRPDLSWWSAARAEIDQRARETRLRLEQLERLLISRVLPTQGAPGQLDHRRWPPFFPGG